MTLTRRDALRHAGSAAMFALIARQVATAREAKAATELTGPLNVLAWEGYDDPELTKGFTDLTGIAVNVKEAASNANQLDLIRAGTTPFDVVNPDAVWTSKFAASGLTMPLDPAEFEHLGELFKPFQQQPDTIYEGKMYGVPTRVGINGYVHWKDKLSVADAESCQILWDPKFKERVSIVDWAELYIDLVSYWAGNKHPETTDGAELDAVMKRLTEFKPNLRALHSDTGSVKTDLVNKDAWIAWGASSDNVALVAKQAGADVELTIPKEGGSMWMETLQIVKGTQNLATAKAYLNYMTSAKALRIMAWGKNQYAVTNSKVMELLTAEQVKLLSLDRLEEWGARSPMGRAPVNEKAWADAWQSFKAA